MTSSAGSPLDRKGGKPQEQDLNNEEEEWELAEFAAKLDRYWQEAPKRKIVPNVSKEWL
jgi:hypothetical protein